MPVSNFTAFNNINFAIFLILALWEIVWKGIGMWYAARNNQKYWFAAILVLNTVGVLPILYLFVFGKKKLKI